MSKVYVAARFERLLEARGAAVELEAAGHEVVARWLAQDPGEGYAAGADVAERDLEDIAGADAVVVLTEDPDGLLVRGGHHVETGYALGLDKCVVVAGPRVNVFHWLPRVTVVATVAEAGAILCS